MSTVKKVILIISILIIIIAVGIGAFLIFGPKKEPKNDPSILIQEYFANISNKEYEKLYDYLTEESKQSISKEAFVTRNKNIYEGIEASNLKIEITQVNPINSEKTQITYVTYMDTMSGKINFNNKMDFMKDKENMYYINWSSKLIYPELEATDKVRVVSFEPKRGEITDRNGKVLAGKAKAYSVGLVVGKMNEDKTVDIQNLSNLIKVSTDKINSEITASYVKSDTFVPLTTISNLDENTEQSLLAIKGVMIKETENRQYPYGEKLAHLVGYIQNINAEELEANKSKGYTANSVIGKSGLEKIYEDRLKGLTGYEIYIADSSENKKHTIVKKAGKDGENIKLTIDADLQSKIYDEYKADKSATVVMNPKTGEVLALVSTPSYNSNDFIDGISQEKWNNLINDANKPFFNRFQATWAPGSSFKPIIGAIRINIKIIHC